MSKKNLGRIAISICLTIIVVLFAWFYWPKHKSLERQYPKLSTVAPAVSSRTGPSKPACVASNRAIPTRQEIQAAREAEIKREQAMVDLWILTPITFYGKVVDEANSAVNDATVALSAADHPFAGGTKYERITDEQGLFSITGIHGAALQVSVSKKGYYLLPESWGNFGYAARTQNELPPHTNPKDPAIFKLRKMGQTEPLIVFDKNVCLRRDGTPMQMDLHTGKITQANTGDIQVQAWTHDKDNPANLNGPYDWRCRVSVPGGGLLIRSGGQFNFEAPSDGYKNEDIIDMPTMTPNWRDQVSQEYFLKLQSGQHALINFTIHAGGDHFFSITSYLNPTPGSRNLEYDPAKTVPNP